MRTIIRMVPEFSCIRHYLFERTASTRTVTDDSHRNLNDNSNPSWGSQKKKRKGKKLEFWRGEDAGMHEFNRETHVTMWSRDAPPNITSTKMNQHKASTRTRSFPAILCTCNLQTFFTSHTHTLSNPLFYKGPQLQYSSDEHATQSDETYFFKSINFKSINFHFFLLPVGHDEYISLWSVI